MRQTDSGPSRSFLVGMEFHKLLFVNSPNLNYIELDQRTYPQIRFPKETSPRTHREPFYMNFATSNQKTLRRGMGVESARFRPQIPVPFGSGFYIFCYSSVHNPIYPKKNGRKQSKTRILGNQIIGWPPVRTIVVHDTWFSKRFQTYSWILPRGQPMDISSAKVITNCLRFAPGLSWSLTTLTLGGWTQGITRSVA